MPVIFSRNNVARLHEHNLNIWEGCAMKNTFTLRIDCEASKKPSVSKVLGCQPNENEPYWEISIVQGDHDGPMNFIDDFITMLNGKYDSLSELDIQRENISIWRYYEYNQECNMEISPREMKLLSENGIVLCISCWQSVV
jgi:hypothetical protein